MAIVKWLSNVNGLWTDPTKWNTGMLPGPGDNVVIDVSASITLIASETVALLMSSASGANLVFTGAGANLSAVGNVSNADTVHEARAFEVIN